jgi:hypothetical protein
VAKRNVADCSTVIRLFTPTADMNPYSFPILVASCLDFGHQNFSFSVKLRFVHAEPQTAIQVLISVIRIGRKETLSENASVDRNMQEYASMYKMIVTKVSN